MAGTENPRKDCDALVGRFAADGGEQPVRLGQQGDSDQRSDADQTHGQE